MNDIPRFFISFFKSISENSFQCQPVSVHSNEADASTGEENSSALNTSYDLTQPGLAKFSYIKLMCSL